MTIAYQEIIWVQHVLTGLTSIAVDIGENWGTALRASSEIQYAGNRAAVAVVILRTRTMMRRMRMSRKKIRLKKSRALTRKGNTDVCCGKTWASAHMI